ncbi:unnamed protein product [Vitrella brassicaformis CCMP3155]|uniref:RxLR effector protein n=1 Tax=Vitrella brassicaformis (strain CCMP3155) TaxID=1169540 RepID=A0A0G4GE25_VITBC|nr:unnamed protein product [Vitrella brassicaformis CCMP3155]|mmetsp:Transcript_32032/g.79430  ORF Transcript_32032/g.79430 Transcript_32032/m.79430 type:complete len:205 (-) Transcript_32032:998-1612(-)|eukprot:CEM27575.1 unnamed protein product [Vitrella brassicaformis CCMP3155]
MMKLTPVLLVSLGLFISTPLSAFMLDADQPDAPGGQAQVDWGDTDANTTDAGAAGEEERVSVGAAEGDVAEGPAVHSEICHELSVDSSSSRTKSMLNGIAQLSNDFNEDDIVRYTHVWNGLQANEKAKLKAEDEIKNKTMEETKTMSGFENVLQQLGTLLGGGKPASAQASLAQLRRVDHSHTDTPMGRALAAMSRPSLRRLTA